MKKVIKSNKSLGSDISDYQKWVDFDMKKYGKISDTTMKDIKKAGLSVVKDQYGDYEVIADDKVEGGCHGKKKVTASLDSRIYVNDEFWAFYHNIKVILQRVDNLLESDKLDKTNYTFECLQSVSGHLDSALDFLKDCLD